MKRFFFLVFFLSSIVHNYDAIGSEQAYNFDEHLSGRQLLDAAIKGNSEKAEQLLKKDPSLVSFLDAYDRTPLHMALSNNRFDIAHMLLDYGSPVWVIDQSGRTPLMAAVFLPKDPIAALRICRRLQKKGANLDNQDNHLNNALMLAAYSCVYHCNSYHDLFNFIVKNTSDLGQRSYDGSTALHYAATSGNSDSVLRLLLEGANCLVKNKKGKTAYDLSIEHHHKQVQELLANPFL